MQKAVFVGLDVHKKTIQVSVMTADGTELINKPISNTPGDIKYNLGKLPKNVKLVMESSSVWKAPFMQIRDELGLDIILSHPYKTKIIAESKKKTDKVDAKILADLLRGGYIVASHIPSKEVDRFRELVRYRYRLVQDRTRMKIGIHAILLQKSIKPQGTPFTKKWLGHVSLLNDYRINFHLSHIEFVNKEIEKTDSSIRDAAKNYEAAHLLWSMPGVGPYTALVVASGIDGIDRFSNTAQLCAYFGMVPSVRSSGDVARYGPITKMGSSLVRLVLTEAIHSHVRFAPETNISKFYMRIAKKRGPSKAAVAAGAKMLKVMFWMLKEKRKFVVNYSQEVSCGAKRRASLGN